MNNPEIVTRLISPHTGEEIILTKWGDNDYDAYWTSSDCSVRGTFDQIMKEIEEG